MDALRNEALLFVLRQLRSYREILVGSLSSGTRDTLPHLQPSWLREDGRLDTERLREAFLAFWRQHGEPLLATAAYHEIAPHLVLMALLHRVINGGGSIEREYAIGRGRMDLCVRYGPDTLAIEIKVWRDKEADPLDEGLAQAGRREPCRPQGAARPPISGKRS